jgi:hypothetical protein
MIANRELTEKQVTVGKWTTAIDEANTTPYHEYTVRLIEHFSFGGITKNGAVVEVCKATDQGPEFAPDFVYADKFYQTMEEANEAFNRIIKHIEAKY